MSINLVINKLKCHLNYNFHHFPCGLKFNSVMELSLAVSAESLTVMGQMTS